MKIGLLAFIADYTETPAKVAKACEALGFESIFIPEHPIIPVERRTPYPAGDGKIPKIYFHMPDPFVSLAFAAGATSRIKVGTGICLVPERSPLLLAKEVATLDLYSGGRVILGIGAGWLAEETEIMGADFKQRWKITREYVRALKELWTTAEPSFAGEFVKFPAVHHNPKPAQKPHPPVHVGAGGVGPNERALKNTAAIGEGWSPIGLTPEHFAAELPKLRKLCDEAGRDFSQIEISNYMLATPKVEPKRLIAQYQEAGVHRLILSAQSLAPGKAEAELENIARTWIS